MRLLRELKAPLPPLSRVAALRDALARAGRERLRQETSRLESVGRNLAHLDPTRLWCVFPLPAMTARASIEAFYRHYL